MIIKEYYKSNFKNKTLFVDILCDYCGVVYKYNARKKYADFIFSKYNMHLCNKCAKHLGSKVKLSKLRIEFISTLKGDFISFLDSSEFCSVRTRFTSNKVSDETLFEYLIHDQFTLEKSLLIKKQYDEIDSLDKFKIMILLLKNVFSQKNSSIEYFLCRGHTQSDAKLLQYEFVCKGSQATKEKCRKDASYRSWFNSTRANGGIAAMNSLKKGMHHRSNPELRLIDFCEKTFGKENVSTMLKTKIEKNSVLYQKYNKHFFCHDICIYDKYIIEYNGSYFHKDMLYKKAADIYSYEYEIEKAFYVTQFSENKDKKYILIWEHDFRNKEKSLFEYVFDIIKHDSTNYRFFSKREEDALAYNIKYKQYKSEFKMVSLYKDWLISLQKISHCSRVKVSAIATTEDHKVIANGVNGTNSGFENCDDHFKNIDTSTEEFKELHGEWSTLHEIHAEMSLLANCVRDGKSLSNATLYISHEPCTSCAKTLSITGIKKIYYLYDYDRSKSESKDLLKFAGVQVYNLNDFLKNQEYINQYDPIEVIKYEQ